MNLLIHSSAVAQERRAFMILPISWVSTPSLNEGQFLLPDHLDAMFIPFQSSSPPQCTEVCLLLPECITNLP